jgi:uncharacterized protein (DUF849 family)
LRWIKPHWLPKDETIHLGHHRADTVARAKKSGGDRSRPLQSSSEESQVLIQVALNGGRTRAEHAAVPITPEELKASAREAVAAGAASIHFHARSQDGRESVHGEDIARGVAAIRSAVPGTPVGVSTGAWILPDLKLRHAAIAEWTLLPDFASVNMKEDGAIEVVEWLLSRGVGVEAGLSDVRGTEIFVASGLPAKCLRVLLEPMEPDLDAALRTLETVESVLATGRVTLPVLLHGLNATAWPFIEEAAKRGYETRIGFEDVLVLPNGESAASNAALVSEAANRTKRWAKSRSG